jgi:hypothetical protein
MNYCQTEHAGNVGCLHLTEHKCVVIIGNNEDEKVCNREAINIYESEVQLIDGKIVIQNLHVCDRHKQVFEEFLNDQGEYQ